MKKFFAGALVAFGLAACGDATDVATSDVVSELRLYAMDCGHIKGPDFDLFGSEGEYAGQPGELAVMCFLIRHPKGDLVWDAGYPDALNEFPDGKDINGGTISVPVTMVSQLASLGLAFEDIEFFAPSHTHDDHVGNAHQLAEATLLIQQAEYDYVFGDGANAPFVDMKLLESLKASEKITFTDDHDVFGDGSVIIVPTPGHTPGHSVLFLNLANAGPVYLSGDLYHIARSRGERIVPRFNFSKPQTLETMKKFETRVAEENARVIIQHSMDEQARLPKLPAYLD